MVPSSFSFVFVCRSLTTSFRPEIMIELFFQDCLFSELYAFSHDFENRLPLNKTDISIQVLLLILIRTLDQWEMRSCLIPYMRNR